MKHQPSENRPLDDIDVRIEETQAGLTSDLRVEVATFVEGEYVESVHLSRARALEIYCELGRILGDECTTGPTTHEVTAGRELPVCAHCSSNSVVADAAARWNVEDRCWDVSNVFDKGHSCDSCHADDITFAWITEQAHIERAAAMGACQEKAT
jgi:hypothetical protein